MAFGGGQSSLQYKRDSVWYRARIQTMATSSANNTNVTLSTQAGLLWLSLNLCPLLTGLLFSNLNTAVQNV